MLTTMIRVDRPGAGPSQRRLPREQPPLPPPPSAAPSGAHSLSSSSAAAVVGRCVCVLLLLLLATASTSIAIAGRHLGRGVVVNDDDDWWKASSSRSGVTRDVASSVWMGGEDAAAEHLRERFAEITNRGIMGMDVIEGNGIDGDDADDYSTAAANRGEDEEEDAPHGFSILCTHYHKTGYVLSRVLTNAVIGLEYQARGEDPPSWKRGKSDVDFFDEATGKRIAFGRRGGWNSNFVPARRHSGVTGCPPSFALTAGAIHVQESPDLFCGDEHLSRLLLGARGIVSSPTNKVKVVHFIRSPYEMALSNYFYHAQEPTPEKWVHYDDPCTTNYNDGQSLAALVLPTIETRTNITREHLDAVVKTCQSLFRSRKSLKNATFYQHLLKLNRRDGLRLATAQMIISSSVANGYLAGGDILRMAQNIIKFENLWTSASIPHNQGSKFQVLSFSMDKHIASPMNTTLRFLDYIFGSVSSTSIPKELRVKAAMDFERNARLVAAKPNIHVTQGKYIDREALHQYLSDDDVFGPVLREVEKLVERALSLTPTL